MKIKDLLIIWFLFLILTLSINFAYGADWKGHNNYTYTGYTSKEINLEFETPDRKENDYYEIRIYSYDKKEYFNLGNFYNNNNIKIKLPISGLYIIEARTHRPVENNEILSSEWVSSINNGMVGKYKKSWWVLGFIEPPGEIIIGYFKSFINFFS